MKSRRGENAQYFSFFNLDSNTVWWSTPRFGRFTPNKMPVSIVQEVGWVSGPVWTFVEILALSIFDHRTVQRLASRRTDWANPTYHMADLIFSVFGRLNLTSGTNNNFFFGLVLREFLALLRTNYVIYCPTSVTCLSGRCLSFIQCIWTVTGFIRHLK